jgi:hypothetical protein
VGIRSSCLSGAFLCIRQIPIDEQGHPAEPEMSIEDNVKIELTKLRKVQSNSDGIRGLI